MNDDGQRRRAALDAELETLANRLRASTVQVFSRCGHGSGLVASADGTVLTNPHVASSRKARVILADRRALDAQVMASAPEVDLAALRVPATAIEPVEFRDAGALRPGDLVMAVGNPLDLVGAVTTG